MNPRHFEKSNGSCKMDRGVKSCIYCHHDIDETAERINEGCRAIASSMKSWRDFIDIMMTVYTRFYSTFSTCRIGSLVLGISTFTIKLQRLPSNTASKYPKFFFSSKQKVVVLSIFLFSIDSFCLQRDTNSHYKDIHSCATTLQFQTLLPE